MHMVLLRPDDTVQLPGASIRAAGVSGQVDIVVLAGTPTSDRSGASVEDGLVEHGVPQQGAEALDAVLRDAGAGAVLAIPLTDLAVAAVPGGSRGPGESPYVELVVDAPDEDEGQVVLEVDAAGVVAWHLSVGDAAGAGDRAGLTRTFRIPISQPDVPGTSEGGEAGEEQRGLFGLGVKKLLHVIRYPLQSAVGAGARLLVNAWEGHARPHGLRLLGPTGLGGPGGLALDRTQLTALSGKPTLLLVHGTFSTAVSGFAGLTHDPALLAELSHRYEGRVLVFDHPTISVDPVANAQWLLDRIPDDVDLVLDVVTHSRGGLVARALTAARTFEGGSRRVPEVRRVIHVATPNAGTTLASRDRWNTLLDAVTNLAMLYPDDTVSVPLTAVVETVKQVGVGVLEGLPGLEAMDPDGAFLAGLAPVTGHGGRHFAIASDFEPSTGPFAVRALDALVDGFFEGGNDLIVPTAGVAAVPDLAAVDVVTLPATPAIAHTGYFGDDVVRQRLAEWLPV
jgi:hypothetical protein